MPASKKIWHYAWRIAALGALAFFSYKMLMLSLPYTAFEKNTGFLRTKANAYHIDYWRAGFYLHVLSSIFVLLAGATQFSGRLIRDYPRVHRRIGMAYVVIVLLISGPGAFVMSLHANGGFPAKVSFTFQSILWICFTGIAFFFAWKRKFTMHGEFMIRSYALTLAAITLRLLVLLFTRMRMEGVRPVEIYITVAWLSWVPNMILAEILIRCGIANYILRKRKS